MLTTSIIWLLIGDWSLVHPGVLLWLVALHLATGFSLGLMFDRVYAASLRDDLTLSYNRRFLTRKMPALLARTKKHNNSLCVTLIDCDDFKKINDEYGHHTGDTMLQVISSFLNENIRKDDYVVRWGGDEFLVIAEHSDYTASHAMIDRLQAELKRVSAERNMPMSVSVGTAVYPQEASSLEGLLRIADHKMYDNKRKRKQTAVC